MLPDIATRLLASAQTNRLAILCGAGLSMAPISSLPSARSVANTCYDRYEALYGIQIGALARDNLELLAEYFRQDNERWQLFLQKLVPWEQFKKQPNTGHDAIADFLLTRAVFAAITTNYDRLIERSAEDLGAEIEIALDGDDALALALHHSPLLKIHGCRGRDSQNTIWALSQLDSEPVKTRLERSAAWLNNLTGKDLLVVGFWSDWSYLNAALRLALGPGHPASVTLIDPTDLNQLQAKAPELWALAHEAGVTFSHVQQDGAVALRELRDEFSRSVVRSTIMSSATAYRAKTGAVLSVGEADFPELKTAELYALRRDLEGVPPTKAARSLAPISNGAMAGLAHALLRLKGGVPAGSYYQLGGETVRVVNGSGQCLEQMKDVFDEAPSAVTATTVIAVGAVSLHLPSKLVTTPEPGNLIRPASASKWIGLDQAIEEMAL